MVQAERLAAVGQTIASLSHHIKNILQGVRGGSYLIEMGMKDHAKAIADGKVDVEAAEKAVGIMRKGWGIVEKNQERISTLVMDMLTFSKEREPVPEAGQPQRAGRRCRRADEDRVRPKKASSSIGCPPPRCRRSCSIPRVMHRAVLNIVTNAIDACSEREQGPR